ncbi:MAG: hypothetical protein HYW02_02615 [Deltaproteobacteria bacterium]|nr:hypothetical protein [Deltaproteobacteria bacterium]MBI2500362.1 hypothetical protein [Deltaproteobacteria bacterium]MBI4196222.1 hypothetical protein [Deltaproteobacteria bacterium]
MRFIALFFSFLSVFLLCLTMAAGLKAGHGQEYFIPHLYWGFATLSVVLITLTLCLLFIFKMHGIIHELADQLESKEKE